MLQDFLLLEMYFGESEGARAIEDVVHEHGKHALHTMLTAGLIVARPLSFGPDTGRIFCWLSDKGRKKSQNL